MRPHQYHFVTHWKIHGPIELIYEVLKDGKNYSRWWNKNYLVSEELDSQTLRCIVRAFLPYTLTFTSQILSENPPHEFKISANGELIGTGLWRLQQNGSVTDIEFFWDVQAQKFLMRWLSFFLKPLFVWNHTWVMRQGELALKSEVEKRGCKQTPLIHPNNAS